MFLIYKLKARNNYLLLNEKNISDQLIRCHSSSYEIQARRNITKNVM